MNIEIKTSGFAHGTTIVIDDQELKGVQSINLKIDVETHLAELTIEGVIMMNGSPLFNADRSDLERFQLHFRDGEVTMRGSIQQLI